jgi:glutaredoxin
MTPVLYVKTGCPYCRAATEYLDERGVAYETVDVRGSDKGMRKLQEISGQMKTPTLQWNGDVLADFGVDQLEEFLKERQQS